MSRTNADIGALWIKHGTKGDYMTGECNGERIICFPIVRAHPGSPAWRILRYVPKPDRPTEEN